jgi:hypothetical protein
MEPQLAMTSIKLDCSARGTCWGWRTTFTIALCRPQLGSCFCPDECSQCTRIWMTFSSTTSGTCCLQGLSSYPPVWQVDQAGRMQRWNKHQQAPHTPPLECQVFKASCLNAAWQGWFGQLLLASSTLPPHSDNWQSLAIATAQSTESSQPAWCHGFVKSMLEST